MRIALNALPAFGQPTGIGHFTRSALRALAARLGDDLLALVPASAPFDMPCARLPLTTWSERFEQFELPALLVDHRIDAYLSPLLTLPIACDVPTAITLHDAIPVTHPELTTAEFRQLWDRWLPPSIRAADRILTVSDSARQDLVDHLNLDPAQLAVVRQTIDPRLGPDATGPLPEPLEPGRYLLAVGSLDPRKNLRRLIDAYARIQTADGANDALALAGPTIDQPPPIPDAIRARVHLLGYVDDARLPALFANARAVVCPSLAEGFGRPLLEAMTSGTPTVASDIPAHRELAGDAAHFAPADDTDALAQALRDVLTDDTLRQRLRADGLARAATFTDEQLADDLIAALTPSPVLT